MTTEEGLDGCLLQENTIKLSAGWIASYDFGCFLFLCLFLLTRLLRPMRFCMVHLRRSVLKHVTYAGSNWVCRHQIICCKLIRSKGSLTWDVINSIPTTLWRIQFVISTALSIKIKSNVLYKPLTFRTKFCISRFFLLITLMNYHVFNLDRTGSDHLCCTTTMPTPNSVTVA